MVSLKLSTLALVALRAWSVVAQDGIQIENIEELQGDIDEEAVTGSSPNLAVEIKTTFPQAEVSISCPLCWTIAMLMLHRSSA